MMGARLVTAGNWSFKHRGLLFPVAVILLLLPSPPFTANAAAVGIPGFLVALFGEAIRVATIGLAYIIRGGKDHRVYAEDLVTSGLYAHCRNPMYLGNLFLLLGLALASNSWVFLLVGVPVALLTHWTMVAAEESYLRNKFGAAYDAYCVDVPRLFPRLRGLASTFQGMYFDRRRVLVSEFAKPVDWLLAVAVVVLLNLYRAGELDDAVVTATLMVVFICARLAMWLAARAAQARYAAVPK